ncbi:MAG: CPBP family intramembrane glutamic endopeptidase [Anaerolineae bacterium]|nr:CPBP family intramembrane metalloprotease [Candidatus Roseilinea sp.]MDW8449615.1 CPBP family intramembrane glutamic endopeptidase [Anaerolineae bacterium]
MKTHSYLSRLDATTRRAVILYTAIVMLPAILVILPFLWTSLNPALLNVVTPVFMWLPALAALIAVKTVIRPASTARYLAMTPLRPLGRLLGAAGIVLAGAVALVSLTLIASQALGFTRIDVVEWSGYRTGDPTLTGEQARSEVLRTLAMLPLFIAGYLFLTTGEELGWRGFLHTALAPLGFWRTAAFTAGLWVIWHAPLLVTSAHLGDIPWRDAVATSTNLFLVSIVISAVRARSGSVWPAAFAHAMLNTVILFGFTAFRTPIDANDHAAFWGFTVVGWVAWLIAIAIATVPWWKPKPGTQQHLKIEMEGER